MIGIALIGWLAFCVLRGAGVLRWRASLATLAIMLGLLLAAHAEEQAAHHHGTPRWRP